MNKLSQVESQILLFIEGAYQDNEFSTSEESLIKGMGGIMRFEEVLCMYESMSTGERMECITDLLYDMNQVGYEFESLNQDLIKLFEIDGHFCRFEADFLNLLERIQQSL